MFVYVMMRIPAFLAKGPTACCAAYGTMAYTKAFGLIKRAETTLGFSLTQRTIGGKGGGGSVLTEGAKELMMRYEAYKTACEQMAENLYNTHFSSFQPQKFADAENKDTEQ